MSQLKINRKNLVHARAVVRQFGKAFLHGCGNIYVKESESEFRRDFSNPGPNNTAPASAYFIELNSVDDVPTSVEACEKKMYEKMAQRQRQEALKANTGKALVETFRTTDEDEAAIEGEDDEPFTGVDNGDPRVSTNKMVNTDIPPQTPDEPKAPVKPIAPAGGNGKGAGTGGRPPKAATASQTPNAETGNGGKSESTTPEVKTDGIVDKGAGGVEI